MPSRAFIVALVGIIIAWVGLYGRMYMKVRVLRTRDLLRRVPKLISKYRQLIREEGAPAWPLIVCIWCLPGGAMIALGAVLWIK